MADFTADAKQFTMDGGIVYDFKDEDDYKTAKKDLSHLKKAMASGWVEEPRQRKVRVNYNESEFLKATMKASKEDKVKGPRLSKMPQLNDFQFFNTQRIEELYTIEHAHETWKFQQHHRRLELEKANTTPEDIEAELNKCAPPRPPTRFYMFDPSRCSSLPAQFSAAVNVLRRCAQGCGLRAAADRG